MNKKEYEEIMAFHPGYYLDTLREDMEISQDELAMRLGTTSKTISKLLNGHISLSKEIALKLSAMFGTSINLWLNLQKAYDEKVLEIEKQKTLDEEIEIVKLIDYKYFEKLGLVEPTRIAKEKVANLCNYLKVSSLDILLKPDFLVNFRSTQNLETDKNIVNSRVWLQTALNIGREIKTNEFNKKKLIESLDEIRSMTVKDPSDFYPMLKKIFSECGVSFVILPHLKNSGINGAVKWINKDKVILAMNDRMKYADIFWFSLFHEIGHVLQQKVKILIISNTSKESINEIDEQFEIQADDFAREELIPTKEYNKFVNNYDFSKRSIINFANNINIHPCIILGRLQKDEIVNYGYLQDLKIKYQIH